MAQPTSFDPQRAAALAEAALPTADDLAGDHWQRDDADAASGALPSLPTALHDHVAEGAVVADADVTWLQRRDGTIVHGLAAVFSGVQPATQTWSALSDESFAERFAASVAELALDHLSGELLGPHMLPSQFTVERSGLRVSSHHARWSHAEDGSLLAVTLDSAALQVGPLVLLVWAATRGNQERSLWRHLLHRCEVRLDGLAV
ncbi:MAG: hypothetical protein JJU45_00860 [Acidimicrobiia bacterium]|nr:hypothetical protein [Acidimicrobiia bacterium]